MNMNDIHPLLSDNGYLKNADDWTKAIAETLAENEHIVLNQSHWHIIDFLRHFHQEYRLMPPVRAMVKALQKLDAKAGSQDLHSLFPQGVIRQASRIAGLPKPPRCDLF